MGVGFGATTKAGLSVLSADTAQTKGFLSGTKRLTVILVIFVINQQNRFIARGAEREWMRRKTMKEIDWTKIANAVEIVKMGTCNRCDIDGVIVYKCGTVIRIDIKNQFE